MSLLTELFGDEIINASLAEVKQKIKNLPPTLKEKRLYLLKDYAAIKGIVVSTEDFDEVA